MFWRILGYKITKEMDRKLDHRESGHHSSYSFLHSSQSMDCIMLTLSLLLWREMSFTNTSNESPACSSLQGLQVPDFRLILDNGIRVSARGNGNETLVLLLNC